MGTRNENLFDHRSRGDVADILSALLRIEERFEETADGGMKLSAILEPLIAAGVSGDVILATVKAFEAEQIDGLNKRRESDAKRQAEKRKRDDSHVMSRDVTVTVPSHAGATKKENKEDKKESKERATRLSEDWTLPDEWRDEAIAAGLPLERVLSEARKMLNWSLSSRNGAKLDWRAVWRNWFQGVLESQAKATAPPPKKVTLASMWRDEGRKQGLLPSHEPPSTSDRRLEAGLPGGTAQGSNFARRIAGAGSG